MEVADGAACRDGQRLLLAAEVPSEARPVAAEAEAFAGAVGAIGRHKLGLTSDPTGEPQVEPGAERGWTTEWLMLTDVDADLW